MAKGMKMREYNISFFKAYIAVTTEAGANITATADGKSYIATADTSGKATIEVKKAGRYTVVASKSGKTAQGVVDVLQDKVTYNISLPFISKILNENSWEVISKVSEAGQGANYWRIGDGKEILLNGTLSGGEYADKIYKNFKIVVFIIGFNHNWEREGKGISFGTFKSKINSGKTYILDDDYQMNQSKTNTGGWKNCNLRHSLLGSCNSKNIQEASPNTPLNPVPKTYMSILPLELRKVLKPIKKFTDNVGGDSSPNNVTHTIDYLPLIGSYEVTCEKNRGNSNEANYQKVYEYYKLGNSTIKFTLDKGEENNIGSVWWLRSPFKRFDGKPNTESFCTMSHNEEKYQTGMYATNHGGVSFVFLV